MNGPASEVDPPPAPPTRVPGKAFLALLLAVSVALAWILWPFYGSILWAAIIALLFQPVYRRILHRLHGLRTPAALVAMLIVLVIIVLPLTFLLATLAREATHLYEGVRSGQVDPEVVFRSAFAGLPDWATGLLHRVGLEDFATLRSRLTSALAEANQWIAAQAFSLGQNTLAFVTGLCITLYLAFFLLRDGETLVASLRQAIPLPAVEQEELLETFRVVLRATVRGNLVVASIQGALGGVAFWMLDIRGAVLWATIMAVLSLVPAVGTGLVMGPMVIYLLVTAPLWQAIALALYGLLVVGLVDNFLRPILVGKTTHLPDYLVLITTLGGIAVIGINGFVLGPVIAALFIAVWRILGARQRAATFRPSLGAVTADPRPVNEDSAG